MNSNDDIHRVFLNKPSQLIQFLFQRVELQTQRGDTVTGGLLAIDPVSDTAVLVDSDNASEAEHGQGKLENFQIVTVPFVNWETIKIIESSPEFRTNIKQLSRTLRD